MHGTGRKSKVTRIFTLFNNSTISTMSPYYPTRKIPHHQILVNNLAAEISFQLYRKKGGKTEKLKTGRTENYLHEIFKSRRRKNYKENVQRGYFLEHWKHVSLQFFPNLIFMLDFLHNFSLIFFWELIKFFVWLTHYFNKTYIFYWKRPLNYVLCNA